MSHDVADRLPTIPERAVDVLLALPFVILGIGLLAAPALFYDQFLWKYFYGPIVADAMDVAVLTRNGVTARPGYTLVSEAGYAYTLVVALRGVLSGLKQYDVGTRPSFFWALVPFVFAGGALRVVEDTGIIPWPVEFFFISPVIYFTLAAITVGALAVSLRLETRGVVDDYTHGLGAFGIFLASTTTLFLFAYGVLQTEFILWVLLAVLLSASVLTGIVWLVFDRLQPRVGNALGLIGPMVIWGHLVDGTATAIGIEMLGYGEKHPVVLALIQFAGTAYVFIPIKALLAVGILSLFAGGEDDDFVDDAPRYTYLFLLAILAVGLGPGTRDVLRVVIGV